jgi:HlyD family secretion protein
MTTHNRRVAAAAAVLAGASCFALTLGEGENTNYPGFVSSAHAQPLRKLIARLRGQKLPDGITKAEGRTEATQVDVSSKYPGQLAEISVDEGTRVSAGQVIAKVSSPEFEAQLRAAQSQLASSREALASANAEIASRQAALDFAKSDFERGQELMKTGFITKQAFEQRQRNYETADAAVKNMTARRDEAQSAIKAAEAKVQEVQAMISDLTLVSPRNGEVQYKLKRIGETVATGEPILTVLDFTDIYMIVFLHAADAGRLVMGDEARIILDAVPDYVIPAKVSFVASDSQFTPKTVETADERAKLMFRVDLRIDPQDLKKYYGRVEPGLRGAGFVLTGRDAKWSPELQVKLPPAPVAQEETAPVSAPADKPAKTASTTQEAAPTPTPAPVAAPPAPPPAAGAAVEAAAPAPSAEAPAPSAAPSAPVPQSAKAPAAVEAGTPPAPAPTAGAAALAAAPTVEPAPASPTPAEAPTSASDMQESTSEIAPESVAQLLGAWAPSAAECDSLFQRRGRAIAYRQPVDQFAQAAIVEPQRIRLPSANCKLERASHEGGALKLSADCQDSIGYTSRTVWIKLRSSSEIVYTPNGDSALNTTLTKCPL